MTYLYENTDFDYIDAMTNKITADARNNGFEVVSTQTMDDWASPGVFIITMYMERKDLDLSHYYTFRSDKKRTSDRPTKSMRTLVRNRYRQLVRQMERRLNRTTPDAKGVYRKAA